jgi:hypothetical protein
VGKGAKRRAHVHLLRFVRVGFACAQPTLQSASKKTGKRSAERRIVPSMTASSAACAQFSCAPTFRRSRSRHSPPASTPMAQPQNRVSRRLPRNRRFSRFASKGTAVKHAPCGPVFVPVDRGPRAARHQIFLRTRGKSAFSQYFMRTKPCVFRSRHIIGSISDAIFSISERFLQTQPCRTPRPLNEFPPSWR